MENPLMQKKGRVLLTFITVGFVCLFSSCEKESEEEPTYEPVLMEYVGVWADNLDQTDLQVSFRASNLQTEDQFTGGFFFNADFEVNANGATSFSFELDGNAIKNIRIDETRILCGGLFIGTGTLMTNQDIQLEVTGEDCSGNRRAVINLTKVN